MRDRKSEEYTVAKAAGIPDGVAIKLADEIHEFKAPYRAAKAAEIGGD
jgi:hypothetical protein